MARAVREQHAVAATRRALELDRDLVAEGADEGRDLVGETLERRRQDPMRTDAATLAVLHQLDDDVAVVERKDAVLLRGRVHLAFISVSFSGCFAARSTSSFGSVARS